MLISQTSTLTETFAGRDQALGAVITNLNKVVGNLAQQNDNLDGVITQTRQLVDQLDRRRPELVSSVGSLSRVMGRLSASATDVYPSTATLSFRTAVYHSTELTLRTTELADNAGRPLQAQSPLDTRLIGAFDVPPYVNSADQSGAVPFLDIANRYILAGAQYNPQVLAGLTAAQIASQLSNPSSPVAQAIDGSAQVIIAALDQILHDKSAPLRAPGVSGG